MCIHHMRVHKKETHEGRETHEGMTFNFVIYSYDADLLSSFVDGLRLT